MNGPLLKGGARPSTSSSLPGGNASQPRRESPLVSSNRTSNSAPRYSKRREETYLRSNISSAPSTTSGRSRLSSSGPMIATQSVSPSSLDTRPPKPMRPQGSKDLEEDELQRQLAQLGVSLGKLKGFTAASRQNSKDEGDTRAVGSLKRMPSNRRPRRLERTASDSEAPRYECDVPTEDDPASSAETKKADVEKEEKKHVSTSLSSSPQRSKRRPAGSRASGAILRRATFSYGMAPSNEPDHHAIAALPPELLLKQVLFDNEGEKPVPKAVRRIPRLERERKQST